MNIFVYPDNMEYVSVHSQRETDREMSQKEREREVERWRGKEGLRTSKHCARRVDGRRRDIKRDRTTRSMKTKNKRRGIREE